MHFTGNFKYYYYLFIFLILYSIVFYLGYEEFLRKDEIRYLYYAKNLLKGYYSPEDVAFIWNGPGYPLFLSLFLIFDAPLLIIRFTNVILLFSSILILFRTFKTCLTNKKALMAAFAFGLYWPMWGEISLMMTETFTLFLITLIVYFSKNYFGNNKLFTKNAIYLGFIIGFLALTKIIFGYVLAISIVILLLILTIYRSFEVKKALFSLSLALLITSPYLIYTYQLTGKPFYWGNSGGMSLYWMSVKHPNEYGSWQSHVTKVSKYDTINQIFKNRHKEVLNKAFNNPPFFTNQSFEKLIQRLGTKQDEYFKKKALKNIANNPSDFIENWVANISRMLFNIPYSYQMQSLNFLKFLVPNILLVIATLISLGIMVTRYNQIPVFIWFLTGFFIIYLFGNSLLSAYPRQFYITAPVLFYLCVYIFSNFLRIKIQV